MGKPAAPAVRPSLSQPALGLLRFVAQVDERGLEGSWLPRQEIPLLPAANERVKAGTSRFELESAEPEPVVLPLHHVPIYWIK